MSVNEGRFVVISGCSGGGKSTLLNELSNKGYLVVPEIGREIVKEQLEIGGNITPWQNPKLFCELLIEKSISAYHKALKKTAPNDQIIFFDRSFLDGMSYYETLNTKDSLKYESFIKKLKFHPIIFMTPPWEEIFCQDDERKHSFEEAVKEYERLIEYYPKCGYQVIEIPKAAVSERVKFILSELS